MRKVINIDKDWKFSKEVSSVPSTFPSDWESIDLPYTFNGDDGQDGGNDYYRGKGYFAKSLAKSDMPDGEEVYLQLDGVNSTGTVYFNGKEICVHNGGYSTFRVKLDDIKDENLLVVVADNSPNDYVYPQVADFTFYGGIYRDVSLIGVGKNHFDLDFYGAPGIAVTPEISGDDAKITVDAYCDGEVEFEISDGNEVVARAKASGKNPSAKLEIKDVHLWDGVDDPFLYTAVAKLIVDGEAVDEVKTRFGCRTFEIDAQKGFILNGREYPLRGVSRHQDRPHIGNALLPEHHKEDMDLICEMGANTIRLAHYQHAQYFYDLCDERGIVVWAEIPYISKHLEKGVENTKSQMKELVYQNYNHPSIVVWGLSNEITMGGATSPIVENHKMLNDLVHSLDKTRLTTEAVLTACNINEEYVHISDVLSYNHYFGWYGGELENNEQWLDKFHALHPDRPLGISEYGAEGIVSYHSDTPKCKDYTEEYQAVYHEHLAKVIDERPWLWATHVWNMFDFGCDARDEGGVKGRNNKGLMTLDRKIRKDAFYLYKAYWSDEEFVHLCSRRYAQRTGEETTVKVYSNLPKVALYVDGRLFAEQEGSKVFVFEHVPMSDGFTQISARAGACADAMSIEKVAEPNQAYIYVDPDDTGDDAGAANWFNVDDYKDVDTIVVREGYFSVKDKIGDIMKNEEAGNVLMQFMQATVKMKLKKSMLGMVKDMTLEGMAGMASSMGIGGKAGADPEQGKRMLITLNEMLNKIKK